MNFDKVVDTIDLACRDKVTGYAYAIFEGKELRRSKGHGFALKELNHRFSADTRMDLGSIGKTITAAAALHAIENHQDFSLKDALNEDGKGSVFAENFLPHHWDIHPTLQKSLTLWQLLTHHSGLTSMDNDKGAIVPIRESLAIGRKSSLPTQDYHYMNLNFDCFRVMLPYLAGVDKTWLNSMIDGMYDRFSCEFYIDYIKENILAKCKNIPSSVTVGNSGPIPYTLYYCHPHEDEGGVDSYYQFWTAGSGGWRMSAKEYGEFIVGLRHHAFFKNGSKAWELMTQEKLGMSETPTSTTPVLKVWEKNGGWNNGRQGYTTAWIGVEDKQPNSKFPSGAFTAVLVINSLVAEGRQKVVPQDVLKAAFASGVAP
jgi:CubicO group peptidase (beta-lactamase class C family)